ncbi:MAG: hypothetical protein UY31_C0008G0014 [Candidatus Wolfebacteria bacterium GW2011_GWE1_48_7]|uniref:Uncharacterized protein n=2 Tax=Candidatus Wolfeibacteriota TaxID=1752735 RepID=A0A0G1U7M5_9BACT|nr:MAG: hypothetical protein UX70_C0001G0678 [Candidatus Wolfebacteria bacterium GW2011_GWB1_47_1]KKU37101.1 MAG: hypothetical protein UX49_C0002G0026 [Candidatus Wolfebacteria bacterium GW2011_GWC2_46_275]KKU42399.1 MAG: hypothetical protein UX58_C0002G0113 [Candidatus Wolfebacteria bacterium GW2011_GWB2_46_69]KKU54365.1 MAG: hypothetical protein UX76_C0003G0061 [Candidatus Wolfebacteria bacterium GW2011_GWC1_47_103]KKU59510.1 MAG: hypothetical protein UX83_C0004G0012 [Candidatus Wolfebacteria
MVFELGPMGRGYVADLFAVEIIAFLVRVMEKEVSETGALSEISILTGGQTMARTLERADKKFSEKHLYIVARNVCDAVTVHNALLRWGGNAQRLQETLKILDSDFIHPCWSGPELDFFAHDIADMILALALILPDDLPRNAFRGRTSWIES